MSAHGRSRVYCYYCCPGKFKYGVCDLESLPKERLDLAVLSQVKQIFTNTELINRVLSRVEAKRTSKVQKKEGELKLLEKEISQRRSLVKKYLSAFESGALQAIDTLNERLSEIEEEIRLLEERKACLAEEIKRSKVQPLTVHDVRKVMGKFKEVILGAGAPQRRAFVRNIVKRIKVHSSSHIEPYYRIPPVRIMYDLAPRTGRC